MVQSGQDNNNKRIKLTAGLIKEIQAEIDRTCVKPYKLLNDARDIPDQLDLNTIYRWLNGDQKTISAKHFDFVLAAYNGYPSNEWVENTPQLQKKIKAEFQRTGVASNKFFKIAPNIPKDFYPGLVHNWVLGRVKKIRKSDLDYVLERYAALPDNKIHISKEMRSKLDHEIARTNIRSVAFLIDHPDKPTNLSIYKAQALINYEVRECRPHHWDFIMSRYAQYPNVSMKALTDHDRSKLTYLLACTHLSYSAVSKSLREDGKRKYSTSFLRDIHQNKIKEISDHAWHEIITFLERAPNIKKVTQRLIKSPERIAITQEMHSQLNTELERTGISLVSLIRGQPVFSKPLTKMQISSWGTGRVKSAQKAHWQYVEDALSSLPDRCSTDLTWKRRSKLREFCKPISKDVLDTIKAHRKRTGVGPAELFKITNNAPEGLNVHIVTSWVSGGSKSANAQYLGWVIDEYQKLPNAL